MTEMDATPRRKFNIFLAVGILFLPIIFVWFLLRTGHSTTARVVGFVWTLLFVAMTVSMGADGPSTSSRPPQQIAVSAEEKAEIERRAAEVAEASKQRELARAPENFLELDNAQGTRGGFDTVFVLSGTIRNTSERDIKDITLRCDLRAASGTQVNSVQETWLDIVPANSSKEFSDLSMGFLGSEQVDGFDCRITDAELVE